MPPLGPKVRVPWEHPRLPAHHDENWRWLLRQFDDDAGVGTRWATVVIAASDSTELSKSTADYICTGSNDQTTIKKAIDLLETRSSTTGVGRVVLLEGTFTLSASIVVNALGARLLAIVGMGGGGIAGLTIGATRVTCTGDECFDLNGSGVSAGSTVILQDMHINSSVGCVVTRDMPTILRDCTLTGGGSGYTSSSGLGTTGGTRIINNAIAVTGGDAIQVSGPTGFDAPVLITDNQITVSGNNRGITCGNNVSTTPSYLVSDNYIVGGGAGNSGIGIELHGNSIENCTVGGNIIKGMGTGVSAGGYRHTISGNLVDGCATGFSTGGDSQYPAFLGNSVVNYTGVAYSLGNSSIRPTVIGNKAANGGTSACSVGAGTTNAFVGYNDFGGGTISDLGTSTTIVSDLPTGGATNFVLKKNSGTTGDYGWALDPAIDAIAGKGSILAGTAVDALTSVTPTKNASLFVSDSTQAAGVVWGRRLFVQDTDPALTITPDLGDIWIDTT